MLELRKIFKTKKEKVSKEDIAQLLKTTPEALDAFETAYKAASFEEQEQKGFFGKNSRQAVREVLDEKEANKRSEEIIGRIAAELLGRSNLGSVRIEDVMQLPAAVRPQLTATESRHTRWSYGCMRMRKNTDSRILRGRCNTTTCSARAWTSWTWIPCCMK